MDGDARALQIVMERVGLRVHSLVGTGREGTTYAATAADDPDMFLPGPPVPTSS